MKPQVFAALLIVSLAVWALLVTAAGYDGMSGARVALARFEQEVEDG